MDDDDLVARLLAGDEGSFARLVERYHASLVRLAQSFVPSRAVAEEVAQETWLAVLKGLPRFEGRSSLKNWIFRILTNRAKTRGTREVRTVPFTALGPEDEQGSAEPDRFAEDGSWFNPPRPWRTSPECALLGAELESFVRRVIDTLPHKQRVVITMRDVEGFSSEDVRSLLEISETYQRVLLHRARVRVREALDKYLAGTR
jgi:RNA polymerase sigma-70 factor (ECF subfamily)